MKVWRDCCVPWPNSLVYKWMITSGYILYIQVHLILMPKVFLHSILFTLEIHTNADINVHVDIKSYLETAFIIPEWKQEENLTQIINKTHIWVWILQLSMDLYLWYATKFSEGTYSCLRGAQIFVWTSNTNPIIIIILLHVIPSSVTQHKAWFIPNEY